MSTVAYPELTPRLAMSIDGARRLEEIDDAAWDRLAAELRYRAATLRSARSALLRRAATQAARLISEPGHDNASARAIATRVIALAAESDKAAP